MTEREPTASTRPASNLSRRGFLQRAGALAGVAAATSLLPAVPALAAPIEVAGPRRRLAKRATTVTFWTHSRKMWY